MTIDEILTGEKENIEYKVDISPKSETYMRTVVAFANGSGGSLVLALKTAPGKLLVLTKMKFLPKWMPLPMLFLTAANRG